MAAGYSANINASDPGGASLQTDMGSLNYHPNSPGNADLPIGTLCPEYKAAGGAVTYVGADKKCQGVQGLRITIGDTAESIQGGFDMVNFNFHCNGSQPRVASVFNLEGPIG